jgi:putative transposase
MSKIKYGLPSFVNGIILIVMPRQSVLPFIELRPRRNEQMYHVRRVNIGKTPQLDELAHECGKLYSQTVTSFWRTVRKKGIWLKPKHLMRWHTSHKLHAHTADACVQAFFASLKSWRERRKTDPTAKPPHKRRWYFRIEYKRSALSLQDDKLTLSNGKGKAPLVLDWPWDLPRTVVIRWTGTQYEAIATYQVEASSAPTGEKCAGIDLGEIHMAVSHDGTETHLLNGRYLRAKRQYRNKLIEHMDKKISRRKQGSRRRKKLIRSKQKQLRKLKNQIKDVEHKQTTRLISTLQQNGVQMAVIGDVRDIRQDLDVGSSNNQQLHQWSHGSVRHMLTYKAERLGIQVALQEESYTSKTCPLCGHRRKSKPRGRVFHCTNKACCAVLHRDLVGACNIRRKYLDLGPVVGAMAPPISIRYVAGVARTEKAYVREAAKALA